MYQLDVHLGVFFAVLGFFLILSMKKILIITGIILFYISSKVEYVFKFDTEEEYDFFTTALWQIS